MKHTCFIFLSLVLLGSCKTGLSNKAFAKPNQPQVVKTDTVYPPITLFNIVYDSTWLNNTEQLTKLNKSLNHLFHDDRVIKEGWDLKRRLDYVKDKSFPKVLAKDFENDAFTKATNIHVSFIADSDNSSKTITVEEWFFKDESLATSCFNSLEGYRRRQIHFTFFSWIWVQQKNKLFLINTSRYHVDTRPMQIIKEHLLTILQDSGEYYRVIEIGF